MKRFESRFSAIGTSWRIALPGVSPERGDALMAQIHARIAEFDKAYSRFRGDSLVAEMARSAGAYRLPDDAGPMMGLYRKFHDLTEGRMTPLIGQTLVEAGYDAAYSLRPKSEVPAAKKWDDAMSYEHPNLTLSEPALLDFGAIGKGYLVDIVAEILRMNGIVDYIVDAGGDIAYSSANGTELEVGLEDPDDTSRAIGSVKVPSGKNIAGSAGNRRAWDRFNHIIDAVTAESPGHIKALWVIADSTAIADGLATALYFTDPERLRRDFDFEYLIVRADRSAAFSRGFANALFRPERQ